MKFSCASAKADRQGPVAWIRAQSKTTIDWTRRHVPPGLRLVLGLLLIGGGIFGFLPILGFWMIPLGIAIAALDIRPVGRAVITRMKRS